jgi:hypothetical protein
MHPHTSSDVDQLQTDVMRFMAIIAFCLMAVLALVKQAEVTAPLPSPASSPTPAATPAPADLTMDPTPPTPRLDREPVAQMAPSAVPQPAEAATDLPSTVILAARTATRPDPRPRPNPVDRPSPASRAVEADTPSPAKVAQPATPEGLSLRFESDQDFMRLLARGDMRLFGWDPARAADPTAAYVLDRDFRFVAATPPARLHELLPATIPGSITRIAPDVPLTWGVALPRRTEAEVNALATRHDAGELVINRYGEVRHERR